MADHITPRVWRLTGYIAPQAAAVDRIRGASARWHEIWSGAGAISGTVRVGGNSADDGQPARRRVRLYDCATGALVAQQWSDAITGAWAFTGLARREYDVQVDDSVGRLYADDEACRVVPV